MTDARGWPDQPGVPANPEREDIGRRIYRLIAAYGWEITWPRVKPVPDEAWPIDIINREVAALLDAARREEREACAAVCERFAGDNDREKHRHPLGSHEWCAASDAATALRYASAAIRARGGA
jgi:hypothetical protein